MSTILDKATITKAKTAITNYKNTCNQLFTTMKGDIDTLVQKGFIGEASTGYQKFIENITPALTTQLTGDENSLTKMLTDILDSVEKSLIETVDPELGNTNQNAISNDQNVSGNEG